MKNASHGRPMWISGNRPAHITAKIVIASAERLIDVRHCWRNSRRMAEISVPAWPIPIQNTKFVMSNAQPTRVVQAPHADAGRDLVGRRSRRRAASAVDDAAKQANHPAAPGRASSGRGDVVGDLAAARDRRRSMSGRAGTVARERGVCRRHHVSASGLRPVPDLRQVADARPGAELLEHAVASRGSGEPCDPARPDR